MRLFTLFLTSVLASASAFAQLSGDGYYRLQNYMTKRYIYVLDDKGSVNINTTSADMNAIQLWSGFDKASCDPATVCYIKKVDSKYDVQAQGTGIYKILETYMGIRDSRSSSAPNTYLAYASQEGITKYISDGEHILSAEKGSLSDTGTGEWRYWYITPISSSSDNYFGVKPAFSLNGKHYTSYYTSFPYSFASSGMKAWYISKVQYGMAVLKEISGTVPPATPVFIECSSTQPSGNKLNIGGSASAISGNSLKGVYFDNPMKTHYNRVAYNASTMRLLGITSEGKLGFITSTIDFIPANTSYLPVESGSPAEIKIVTEAQFNEAVSNFPTSVTAEPKDIYFYSGDTRQIVATVLPAGANDQLTWTTDNSKVVTVDQNGLATAIGIGYASIYATTVNGLKARVGIAVKERPIVATSLTLDASSKTIEEGQSCKLTATVLPDNTANKKLSWTSSNTSVATVDADGNVKAIAPGSAQIKVTTTDGSNLSASCALTVTRKIVLASSISLNVSSQTINTGEALQLIATVLPDNTTNKSVTWKSSNTVVASVDASGKVNGLAVGTSTITATTTDGTNLSASCVITVKKQVVLVSSLSFDITSTQVYVGDKFTITATIAPSNAANKAITWSSSNRGVAIVDQSGNVTTLAQGTTQIKAVTTDGSNLTATCDVTVVPRTVLAQSISLNKTSAGVEYPSQFTLVATVLPANTTNKTVRWYSSNDAIASVNSSGVVDVKAAGKVKITATTTDGSNLSATCEVNAASGVELVFASATQPLDVYNLQGIFIMKAASQADLRSLQPGYYLVGGTKVFIPAQQ